MTVQFDELVSRLTIATSSNGGMAIIDKVRKDVMTNEHNLIYGLSTDKYSNFRIFCLSQSLIQFLGFNEFASKVRLYPAIHKVWIRYTNRAKKRNANECLYFSYAVMTNTQYIRMLSNNYIAMFKSIGSQDSNASDSVEHIKSTFDLSGDKHTDKYDAMTVLSALIIYNAGTVKDLQDIYEYYASQLSQEEVDMLRYEINLKIVFFALTIAHSRNKINKKTGDRVRDNRLSSSKSKAINEATSNSIKLKESLNIANKTIKELEAQNKELDLAMADITIIYSDIFRAMKESEKSNAGNIGVNDHPLKGQVIAVVGDENKLPMYKEEMLKMGIIPIVYNGINKISRIDSLANATQVHSVILFTDVIKHKTYYKLRDTGKIIYAKGKHIDNLLDALNRASKIE